MCACYWPDWWHTPPQLHPGPKLHRCVDLTRVTKHLARVFPQQNSSRSKWIFGKSISFPENIVWSCPDDFRNALTSHKWDSGLITCSLKVRLHNVINLGQRTANNSSRLFWVPPRYIISIKRISRISIGVSVSIRPRTHGNVFLRFCIVSSNELDVLENITLRT